MRPRILPIVALCLLPIVDAQLQAQNPAPARDRGQQALKTRQLPLSSWPAAATFQLHGKPDWLAIAPGAVWIANAPLKAVQRVDPRRNEVVARVEFPVEPCSGLVFAFGNLWVPLCGKPATLARVDPATNKIVATLPFGPADDEGGIAASDDSVWIVANADGTLLRIDPATNTVRQRISISAGSFNPIYSDGFVWISGHSSGVLTPVDARTGEVLPSIRVGPQPRFLTVGANSIWTLNQGDGSITRVDKRSRRAVATIQAGIPGHGGEICFGAGSVWATTLNIPLTQVSPATNRVVHQWTGSGGDSVRFGHDSLWLTHLRAGLLWRMSPPALTQHLRPASLTR